MSTSPFTSAFPGFPSVLKCQFDLHPSSRAGVYHSVWLWKRPQKLSGRFIEAWLVNRWESLSWSHVSWTLSMWQCVNQGHRGPQTGLPIRCTFTAVAFITESTPWGRSVLWSWSFHLRKFCYPSQLWQWPSKLTSQVRHLVHRYLNQKVEGAC